MATPIENQIVALIDTVMTDDEATGKVLLAKLIGDLLTDITRIADAVEAIALNTQPRMP